MKKLIMRFNGGKAKALTFSYDDGFAADEKLINIFNKYGMKGTFNLNSGSIPENPLPKTETYVRLSESEVKELYKNHEVAVHGVTHAFMSSLDATTLTGEIYEDRRALERITGRIVNGMAYPYGRFGGDFVDVCLKSCGIKYSRVTGGTGSFNLPENWYYWHPTCHHTDERLMPLAKQFLEYDTNRNGGDQPKLFYCWGHSFEFVNNNNWEVIEEFCKATANNEEIWYATNMEIYNYIEAYRHLVWGINRNMVYNPTAFEVWFRIGTTDYSVKPGETIKI